jgi:hypothetical protein
MYFDQFNDVVVHGYTNMLASNVDILKKSM